MLESSAKNNQLEETLFQRPFQNTYRSLKKDTEKMNEIGSEEKIIRCEKEIPGQGSEPE